MIYQSNNDFTAFSFLAKFEEGEQYISDKEQFEEQLLEQKKQEATSFNPESGEEEVGEYSLPEITYEAVVLTPEQEEKLAEVNTYPSITLDEARAYVEEGTAPTNTEYLLAKKDEKIAALESTNMHNMLAMADMYEESIVIKNTSTATMLAVAELYETILSGGA